MASHCSLCPQPHDGEHTGTTRTARRGRLRARVVRAFPLPHPLHTANKRSGTHWGSRALRTRLRRLRSASMAASSSLSPATRFTSRDAVSESRRRLKSLHSTGRREGSSETRPHRERPGEWAGRGGACHKGCTHHSGSEPRTPGVAGYTQ